MMADPDLTVLQSCGTVAYRRSHIKSLILKSHAATFGENRAMLRRSGESDPTSGAQPDPGDQPDEDLWGVVNDYHVLAHAVHGTALFTTPEVQTILAYLVCGHHDFVEKEYQTCDHGHGKFQLFVTRLPVSAALHGSNASPAPGSLSLFWRRDPGPQGDDGGFLEVVRLHSLCPTNEEPMELQRIRPLVEERTRRLQMFLRRPLPRVVRGPSGAKGPAVRHPRLFWAEDWNVRSLQYFFRCLPITDALLDYLFTSSRPMLVLNTFPIQTTAEEKAVIRRSFTDFVLLQGRSGTGKTLCCIYAMLQWFAHFAEHRDYPEYRMPHLVFLTKSATLCGQVARHFASLTASPEVGLRSAPVPLQQLPPSLDEACYPLFVTYRRLLVMVEGTLQKKFFARSSVSLHHYLNETDVVGDLPKGERKELTSGMFFNVVWKQMVESLPAESRARYSAAQALVEITSTIKGSYMALMSPDGHLSESEYAALPKVGAGPQQRRDMYTLFQAYERIKRTQCMYDHLDVVHYVYCQRLLEGHTLRPLHFVFVDEVQDLTQAELALFFQLCPWRFLQKGLFLVGDVSQTVTHGVEFRFQDLASLFRHELNGWSDWKAWSLRAEEQHREERRRQQAEVCRL